jgi:dienelactone hydrolase
MSKQGIVAGVFAALLLTGGTAVALDSGAAIVELESPLAHSQPLQGLLRRPAGAGPFPAIVLLHSCNGNWQKLDERWARQIAPWGYVTLTVDSFGPRGIDETCGNGTPSDMAFDAYRALDFLVRQHAVDPDRVAVLGFSQGGWLALSSVEHGVVERSSSNKFRAAAAFYPNCRTIQGSLTVPALIMIGELDDWTSAEGCRRLAEGSDDYGVARRREGAPIKLIVYPGAYHAFDSPALRTPKELFGHRLQYNQAAAEQSAVALRAFLDAQIGGRESGN